VKDLAGRAWQNVALHKFAYVTLLLLFLSALQLTQLPMHSFLPTGQRDRRIDRRAQAFNFLSSLLPSCCCPEAHPRLEAIAEKLLHHCSLAVLPGGPVRSMGRLKDYSH
jgi:hypothetical protein